MEGLVSQSWVVSRKKADQASGRTGHLRSNHQLSNYTTYMVETLGLRGYVATTGKTRDEIFDLRDYGASMTAGILGMGYENQTRYRIFLEKAFSIKFDFDEETLARFRWGNRLEDDIAEEFEFVTGMKFAAHQVLVRHPELPWMTALIDGVTECGRIVDFKSMGFRSLMGLEDGDPSTLKPLHHCQAQHQMAVCEKDEAHWACFGDMKLLRFVIPRDDEMIELIIHELKEFKHCVDTQTPPTEFAPADFDLMKKLYSDVDGEELDFTDDYKIDLVASKLVEAKKVYSDADSEIKRLKAELLEAMATAGSAELMNHTLQRKHRHRDGYKVDPSDYVELICKPKFSTNTKRKGRSR
jgi:putative phage-type endonuclease